MRNGIKSQLMYDDVTAKVCSCDAGQSMKSQIIAEINTNLAFRRGSKLVQLSSCLDPHLCVNFVVLVEPLLEVSLSDENRKKRIVDLRPSCFRSCAMKTEHELARKQIDKFFYSLHFRIWRSSSR